MKTVAKYNLFKGISTLLTTGTPIITLAACGETFVTEPKASLSAAAIFAILLSLLAFKDKIAEKVKSPTTFMVSMITLIFILIVENVLLPVKFVCIATICTSGIDELTFKKLCENIKLKLPKEYEQYLHAGFIFCKTQTLEGVNENA